MTLLRQLMFVVIILFLILFTANFILTVLDSRLYLENQLQSHADDTASSLGLSMTTALQQQDIAHLDVLASAIFDRGYYQSITLLNLDGEIMLKKTNLIVIDDVPAWFVSLIKLPTPVGQAEIMNGWNRLGVLSVVSHPGHAYRDLWRITVDFFYLFTSILLLSYALLGLALKFMLSPLKAVEEQADAICEKKFITVDRIPRTRELKRVVEAMNRMSRKMSELFSRQVELTESLRQEARTDPVTGLMNRREFNAVLSGLLGSESGGGSGALALIQIKNLEELNQRMGHSEGDAILKQIGDNLSNEMPSTPGATGSGRHGRLIARYSGAGFAIYFANISLEHARVELQKLQTSLDSLQILNEPGVDLAIDTGMTFQLSPESMSSMLTEADTALRTAQSRPKSSAYFFAPTDGNPLSNIIQQANEWRRTLETVLTNEDILLYYQPIYKWRNGEESQSPAEYKLASFEVFMRIQVEDEVIQAGTFLPMAERFDWLPDFDKIVISRVFAQLETSTHKLVVNLSTRSILDNEFANWLTQFLTTQSRYAPQVIFELQEHAIQISLPKVKKLIEFATPLGFKFSVDQFGISQSTFAYLHSLDIAFLKIDRSIVDGISSNPDNQFFVQSVIQIAETRDITIIAEGVEHKQDLESLHLLGVDMAMGYLLGRPAADVGNFPQEL